MKTTVLVVLALSLLLVGCATAPQDASEDVSGDVQPPVIPDAQVEEVMIDVDTVDEGLVEDDLEQAMASIDLDDW